MGGAVIVLSTPAGLWRRAPGLLDPTPTWSGILVLFLMTGLGLVGFLDDYIKISQAAQPGPALEAETRRPDPRCRALRGPRVAVPNGSNRTPARPRSPSVRDTSLDLAFAGTVGWAHPFIIWEPHRRGHLECREPHRRTRRFGDGASVMVFAAYILIGVWEFNQNCQFNPGLRYEVRDPHDLANVAAAAMGACFGFLWWNTSPAKIFMGDTGSFALAASWPAWRSRRGTQLLVIILGGLFVIITLSVIIQVASFKATGKRVFRTAPLQHHFELLAARSDDRRAVLDHCRTVRGSRSGPVLCGSGGGRLMTVLPSAVGARPR